MVVEAWGWHEREHQKCLYHHQILKTANAVDVILSAWWWCRYSCSSLMLGHPQYPPWLMTTTHHSLLTMVNDLPDDYHYDIGPWSKTLHHISKVLEEWNYIIIIIIIMLAYSRGQAETGKVHSLLLLLYTTIIITTTNDSSSSRARSVFFFIFDDWAYLL